MKKAAYKSGEMGVYLMKRILVILVATMLLTGCLGGNNEKDAPLAKEKESTTVQVNESPVVKENETSAVQENNSSDTKEPTAQPQDADKEDTTVEEKTGNKTESTAIVLENEGDIVITVPDDEEFGGE